MLSSSLQIHLSPSVTTTASFLSTTTTTTIAIKATITNSSSTPITLLNWSTPLDPHADIIGVFQVRDETTNETLSLPTINLSRRTTPFLDDLVEVPAEGAVETLATFARVPLTEGHRYAIQATGIWHALWEGPLERRGCRTDHHRDNKPAPLLFPSIPFPLHHLRPLYIPSLHPASPPNIPADALRVFHVLQNNGIALVPASVGHGLVATSPAALDRLFHAKRRKPHKKHALIGTYALHASIHDLPPREASIVRTLTVDLDLPLGVVGPFHPHHPLIQTLGEDVLERCTVDGTISMFVNGGPFQEELVRLCVAVGVPLLGSSANLTGTGTKVLVEDVEREIVEVAVVVVDYGRRPFEWPRASSTILDFRDVRVVRFGACYEARRLGMRWGGFGAWRCRRILGGRCSFRGMLKGEARVY
ncbi:hypothetical protein BO71DRAFT_440128 [Aspergillus ellipticus CBS 707.79]|uniref:Threonylcarbamoyl-AMP synthase n=1 Tax=Aspergillus ellipticus CBS 707.79 TaxID=1448320 RepID=A0A319DWE0_9EURO|nr:hypothetical protein BO71DRAFT_440128 [Aspergillus ellipticus CBS 707.79]